MKTLAFRIALLACGLAIGSISSFAGSTVFRKSLEHRGGVELEVNTNQAVGFATNGPVTVPLFHYRLLSQEASGTNPTVLWEGNLPAYGTNAIRLDGFYLFDAAPLNNAWALCYKLDRTTFVESAKGAPAAEGTRSKSAEIMRDFYGAGRVAKAASFGTTNGVPVLRVVLRTSDTMVWMYTNNMWLRATQYDVILPLRARPDFMNDPRVIRRYNLQRTNAIPAGH